MERNKASYSKKKMICLKCSKTFVDLSALRKHMLEAHDVPNYRLASLVNVVT